jgi:hypothetical protein
MAYDFFRRPQLAGNTLKFLKYATIRGSVRRNDPDGISSNPYFLLGAGGTLDLKVNGIEFLAVTFASANPSLQSILSAINTAIAGQGVAFDDDGVVGIRSLAAGEGGSVEVTGGSAAKAIGFDTSIHPVSSLTTYLATSPEGRIGNSTGTSFPTQGEGLTTDTINRALGHMAANTDVLYAAMHQREKRLLVVEAFDESKVAHMSAGDYSVLGPFAGPISTCVGEVASPPTQEEIAKNFFLMDGSRMSASRIEAITGQAPTVMPVAANATNVGQAGNVLGRNLIRAGPIQVDDIKYGTTVVATAGGFGGVHIGDLVEFNEGVNPDNYPSTPWRNKGMRWVVEAVATDGTQIEVRPMSDREIETYGVDVSAAKNVLELNGAKTLSQTFGTVTIYTGGTAENIYLVVRPRLHREFGFTLVGMVPTSLQSKGADYLQLASERQFVGQRNLPDAVLSRPTIVPYDSVPSFRLRVSGFWVRYKDRVYPIQEKILDLPAVQNDRVWISWRPMADILYSVPAEGSFDGEGMPLAYLSTDTSGITIINDAVRVEQLQDEPITVGAGGEFPTIQKALTFLAISSMGGGPPGGSIDPTIILLESTSMFTPISETIVVPDGLGVTIRGAHPDISLYMGPGSFPLFSGSGHVYLEDVVILGPNTNTDLVADLSTLTLRGVRFGSAALVLYRDHTTEVQCGRTSVGPMVGDKSRLIQGARSLRFETDQSIDSAGAQSFEVNGDGLTYTLPDVLGDGLAIAGFAITPYRLRMTFTKRASDGTVHRDVFAAGSDTGGTSIGGIEYLFTSKGIGTRAGAFRVSWDTVNGAPLLTMVNSAGGISAKLSYGDIHTLTDGGHGGTSQDADGLHFHGGVPAGFSIGGLGTDALSVTATALDTLTDGSNADGLHTHVVPETFPPDFDWINDRSGDPTWTDGTKSKAMLFAARTGGVLALTKSANGGALHDVVSFYNAIVCEKSPTDQTPGRVVYANQWYESGPHPITHPFTFAASNLGAIFTADGHGTATSGGPREAVWASAESRFYVRVVIARTGLSREYICWTTDFVTFTKCIDFNETQYVVMEWGMNIAGGKIFFWYSQWNTPSGYQGLYLVTNVTGAWTGTRWYANYAYIPGVPNRYPTLFFKSASAGAGAWLSGYEVQSSTPRWCVHEGTGTRFATTGSWPAGIVALAPVENSYNPDDDSYLMYALDNPLYLRVYKVTMGAGITPIFTEVAYMLYQDTCDANDTITQVALVKGVYVVSARHYDTAFSGYTFYSVYFMSRQGHILCWHTTQPNVYDGPAKMCYDPKVGRERLFLSISSYNATWGGTYVTG